MSTHKIEPRLRAEIARLRELGQDGTPIPVLLELVSEPASAEGIEELERRVRRSQAPVLQWLQSAGATDLQPSTLANVIAARLTADPIEAACGLAQVKRLLWNRLDSVTPMRPH